MMNFFIWLEEHQIGILTTIALHLMLFCAVLMTKININIEREHSIMIDISHIDFDVEEVVAEENMLQQESQTIPNFYQTNEIRNIPVNIADRAAESIDRMIRDIKAEENITDPPPSQDIPAQTNDTENVNTYNERFPENATGERTVYRGQTTVSYELTGRRHTWMPMPVYRCRAGGTIVVNIAVNGNGYVVAAEINRGRSNSEDPCLIEASIRDAERSRFNESTTARQQGTITYLFQAQ